MADDVRRFDDLVRTVGGLRRQLEQLQSTALNRLSTHTHAAAHTTGVVDPAYTTGKPKVTLAGAAGLTASGLDRLSSYTPTASDPVLIAVVGSSYVILGKVV